MSRNSNNYKFVWNFYRSRLTDIINDFEYEHNLNIFIYDLTFPSLNDIIEGDISPVLRNIWDNDKRAAMLAFKDFKNLDEINNFLDEITDHQGNIDYDLTDEEQEEELKNNIIESARNIINDIPITTQAHPLQSIY